MWAELEQIFSSSAVRVVFKRKLLALWTKGFGSPSSQEGEATPDDQRVRVSDQVLCLKLKSQATSVVSIFDLGSRFCNLYLRSVPVHPSYWLRHRIILTWGSSHKGGVEKKWNKFKAFSIRRRQKDKVKGFRYRVWLKSSIVGFLDCIGQTDPNEPNSSALVDLVTLYLEKTS